MNRVLVVDDDLSVCEFLELLLSLLGYDADSVTSAESALERLSEGWDCILLDGALPGISGPEAAYRLSKSCPVIGVTGAGIEVVQEFYRAGCLDVVRKPFTLLEIQTVVERALKVKKES